MSPQSGKAVFWLAAAVSSLAVLGLAHVAWVAAAWYRQGSALARVQDAHIYAFVGCTAAVGLSLVSMLASEALRRRGAIRSGIALMAAPAAVSALAVLAQIAVAWGVPVADVYQ